MNEQSIQKQRDEYELALHDSTIQNLFGLGLRLEICRALIEEDAPDEAQHALNATIASLDHVIETIRDRIYTLDRRSGRALAQG